MAKRLGRRAPRVHGPVSSPRRRRPLRPARPAPPVAAPSSPPWSDSDPSAAQVRPAPPPDPARPGGPAPRPAANQGAARRAQPTTAGPAVAALTSARRPAPRPGSRLPAGSGLAARRREEGCREGGAVRRRDCGPARAHARRSADRLSGSPRRRGCGAELGAARGYAGPLRGDGREAEAGTAPGAFAVPARWPRPVPLPRVSPPASTRLGEAGREEAAGCLSAAEVHSEPLVA